MCTTGPLYCYYQTTLAIAAILILSSYVLMHHFLYHLPLIASFPTLPHADMLTCQYMQKDIAASSDKSPGGPGISLAQKHTISGTVRYLIRDLQWSSLTQMQGELH